MPYTIYKATDTEGRSYIGCTILTAEQRWKCHETRIGSADSISQAIPRFGRSAFTLETLATVENEADAAEVEMLMMRLHNTVRPHGYNSHRAKPYFNWHVAAQRRAA